MERLETVPLTGFTLIYEGKNITAVIAEYAVKITFKDSVENKASSLEIELQNEDGRWSNEWYPQKGDKISCSIGKLKCGTFCIDETELSGPPDIVKISALENLMQGTMRTKKTRSHENKSIRQIAQLVANANSLTLVGNVPDITIERVTQRQETDLKFLRRISYDYGIIFSVRDSKLVYESLYDIDKRGPSFTVDKTDITGYSLKDKTSEVFKDCKVKYHNPDTKKIITHTVTSAEIKTVRNNDGIEYREITSGDTLVINKKVENTKQAEAVATASLYRKNSQQQSGSISMPGNEYGVAGNNFELTGLGVAGSGIMNIQEATHTLTKDDGHKMELEFKRVAVVSKQKQKGKKYVKPTKITDAKVATANFQNKDNLQYRKIIPFAE